MHVRYAGLHVVRAHCSQGASSGKHAGRREADEGHVRLREPLIALPAAVVPVDETHSRVDHSHPRQIAPKIRCDHEYADADPGAPRTRIRDSPPPRAKVDALATRWTGTAYRRIDCGACPPRSPRAVGSTLPLRPGRFDSQLALSRSNGRPCGGPGRGPATWWGPAGTGRRPAAGLLAARARCARRSSLRTTGVWFGICKRRWRTGIAAWGSPANRSERPRSNSA